VQYDDRNTDEFRPLIQKNKEYAEFNSIDYIFLNKGYESYPPWWRKVFIIKDLLPHYNSILWIDTDACILKKQHFETLFQDKHFVFSPNPPPFQIHVFSNFAASFCAGIWAVKNTEEGKTILNEWSKCYKEKNWTLKNGVWSASVGEYGGISYEQGSFQTFIERKYWSWLGKKQHWVLNYLPKPPEYFVGPDTFAVHFWKGNRDKIAGFCVSKNIF
jgi:hypothetical protein